MGPDYWVRRSAVTVTPWQTITKLARHPHLTRKRIDRIDPEIKLESLGNSLVARQHAKHVKGATEFLRGPRSRAKCFSSLFLARSELRCFHSLNRLSWKRKSGGRPQDAEELKRGKRAVP